MKRRINNFHKSKPIVQNVKTDSVNEGKAPKNLTLANDISDWNPGVAHDQISEADGDGVANTFEEAIGGKDQKSQGGGAAAPTSYSEAVNRFLIVRGAQARYKENAQKWTEAREKYISNTEQLRTLKSDQTSLQDQYDSYTSDISSLEKDMTAASDKGDTAMVAIVSKKMNQVIDMNQDMVSKYNGVAAQIDSVEKNLANANANLDAAQAAGREAGQTLNNWKGEIPDIKFDMKDPRDIVDEDPVKGDPVVKDPANGDPVKVDPDSPYAKDPNPGLTPGDNLGDFIGIKDPNPEAPLNKIISEVPLDKEADQPTAADGYQNQVKSIQQALTKTAFARREQEAALQNPDEELLPTDAKTVVREFQPESDMHEAVKAGGIGLDIIADGGQVEKPIKYWHFHECTVPGIQYYTTVNLDASTPPFPSPFDNPATSIVYVRDGVTAGAPLLGGVDGSSIIASSVDGNGNYNGSAAGTITCLE